MAPPLFLRATQLIFNRQMAKINLEAEAQPQLPLRPSASRLIVLTHAQKQNIGQMVGQI